MVFTYLELKILQVFLATKCYSQLANALNLLFYRGKDPNQVENF